MTETINPDWAEDYKRKIAVTLEEIDLELLAKHPAHIEQPADTQGEQ